MYAKHECSTIITLEDITVIPDESERTEQKQGVLREAVTPGTSRSIVQQGIQRMTDK